MEILYRLLYSLLVFCFFVSANSSTCFSQVPEILELWEYDKSSDAKIENEIIENQRITNVQRPTITVFTPNIEAISGTAILICPGGGYHHVTINKEGYQIAKWLNRNGITGIVLKYRLDPQLALEDAIQAMRIVRSRAAEWKIDPSRIGVMGFSAGAHLAINLSTHYDLQNSQQKSDVNSISARPDFTIPVYCTIRNIDLDSSIKSNHPPTLLIHASDDGTTSPVNSINYYLKLMEAKVPVEMHIYEQGGHGFGIMKTNQFVAAWPDRCIDWLYNRGIINQR